MLGWVPGCKREFLCISSAYISYAFSHFSWAASFRRCSDNRKWIWIKSAAFIRGMVPPPGLDFGLGIWLIFFSSREIESSTASVLASVVLGNSWMGLCAVQVVLLPFTKLFGACVGVFGKPSPEVEPGGYSCFTAVDPEFE